MRELRFITRTSDGALLVESEDGLDHYRIVVDEGLRAAVAKTPAPPVAEPVEPVRPGATASTGPSPVGPREIQVRVRAGESPESLAEEFGADLAHVMRFAGPVLAERLRITDEARRARARRTGHEDAEPRVVVFGEAVEERFGAHGIDADSVQWDSRRREDGEWIVVATWLGGEGTHGAEWLFHRGSRTVSPLDDSAADLLSDRPIRPVAPPAPVPHLSVAPPLAPGVIAFPPFPDAHTGPIPRLEEVFDQEDVRDLPRTLPPFVSAPPYAPQPHAGPSIPATSGMDEFEEPPLPLAITDAEGRPAAAGAVRNLGVARPESEDDKAARARIPSWDDILLGVRRKQD